MPRKYKPTIQSGYSILVVDDDLEYLHASRVLLEREGHAVFIANSGPEALSIIRERSIDLMLLDYFMPKMNGEEVIGELRKFNQIVQIVLQTGYADEKPPREMLKRLDIQGYYNKSEGPDKFLLWTEIGLKAAYTAQLLYKSRESIHHMLNVPQDLHKTKPLTELLQGILWQIVGLMEITDSFLAVEYDPQSYNIEINRKNDFKIFASSGRFWEMEYINQESNPEISKLIFDSIDKNEITVTEDCTIIPLRIGTLNVGVLYLDQPIENKPDQEILLRFSKKAAIAIQNVLIFEKLISKVRT